MKIFVDEPESSRLREYFDARPGISSCALARVEVARAVKLHHGDIYAVERFFEGMNLVELGDGVLAVAADLTSGSLRSVDAIHLAAALTLRRQLSALVTYDRRMATAALTMGLPVASAGSSTT